MILSALACTKRIKYKNKQTHSNTSTNYQMFLKKQSVKKCPQVQRSSQQVHAPAVACSLKGDCDVQNFPRTYS